MAPLDFTEKGRDYGCDASDIQISPRDRVSVTAIPVVADSQNLDVEEARPNIKTQQSATDNMLNVLSKALDLRIRRRF